MEVNRMPENVSQPVRADTDTPNQATGQSLEITPELVNKIADQVFQELKRDLAIERERSRLTKPRPVLGTGRWP